ncbi:MAG: DUF1934 domain-containing protein [Clostridia bacterium]|nr:DUF1934 domain-containing protein [Clostridia bacterium]
MQVTVKQHSYITRFQGTFSSLAEGRGPISAPADKEEIHTEGIGALSEQENGFLLSFQEKGKDGEAVTLRFSRKENTLYLTRGKTKMVFALAKETSFSHYTYMGEFLLKAYTRKLEQKSKDGSFLFVLEYDLLLSGMLQKNRILFHFGKNL